MCQELQEWLHLLSDPLHYVEFRDLTTEADRHFNRIKSSFILRKHWLAPARMHEFIGEMISLYDRPNSLLSFTELP